MSHERMQWLLIRLFFLHLIFLNAIFIFLNIIFIFWNFIIVVLVLYNKWLIFPRVKNCERYVLFILLCFYFIYLFMLKLNSLLLSSFSFLNGSLGILEWHIFSQFNSFQTYLSRCFLLLAALNLAYWCPCPWCIITCFVLFGAN